MSVRFLICFCFIFSICLGDAQNAEGQEISIVPKPVKIVVGKGDFQLKESTRIQFLSAGSSVFKDPGSFYSLLSPSLNKPLPLLGGKELEENAVILQLDESVNGGDESYILDVTSKKIVLSASSERGIFYGIQTLSQLKSEALFIQPGNHLFWNIPAVHIEDQPRFGWRGMHLDVSRHFYSMDYLKKFIGVMAAYKFNRFHLHLTDDQGWRMEIKKYPLLTEKGAWRELNDQDKSCMEMAKTNPDFNLPAEFFKNKGGKKLYGGFYTQAQMRELISYAEARNIIIVPEIDMPGHMMAAIQAYPNLACTEKPGWGTTFSTPLCPCKEEVYTFLENVLSEITALFPSEYIHIGADEVDKASWASSALCKDLMLREEIKSTQELQSYFVKRMETFLNSKGKKMIGWDEVLEGGVDSTTTVMYWRGWVKDAPRIAAKAGNRVIMTPTDFSYFNYKQDENTLEKLYNGKVIPDGLTDTEARNIMGVQGNIWTEYIPTPNRLEYMAFPRALAMAELGWSAVRDFDDFHRRMQWQYKLLEQMGVNFRIPDIKNVREHVVFIDTVVFTLQMPANLNAIRYTTDGSDPSVRSAIYSSPVVINKDQVWKLAGFTNSGRRGDISTVTFEKQAYLKSFIKEAEISPGVRAAYFEGEINNLKKLASLPVIKDFNTENLSVPPDHSVQSFGLVYSGFIKVIEKGIYTFYLNADDGASLTIGNKLVINNDGPHAPTEKSGEIALEPGFHPFTLPFYEAGGGFTLELKWAGPGFLKQPVANDHFYRKR